MGRVPVEGAGGLDLDGHVDQLVFERLEVPDRHAELLARLGVLDAHLHQGRTGRKRVRRQQHEPRVPHPRRRIPALRQGLARRAIEVEHVQASRAIDAAHGPDLDARRRTLHQNQAAAGHPHDDHLRKRAVGHVQLAAGELPVAGELPLLGLPQATLLAERDGGDGISGGQPRQPGAPLLLAASQPDRQRGERVTEERPRCSGAAERLGRERQVDQLEAGATVLLGQVESREAELRHALPQGRIEARLPLEDLAHHRHRALVLEELGNRLLEQLLLVRESEVHLPGLPCA